MSTSPIDLTKTNTALVDSTGSPANAVDFTVFWRAKAAKGIGKFKGAAKVDLDLSVICFNADKRPIAVCNGHDEREPFSAKALYHTGDTKSGRSGGEQSETVQSTLSGVPTKVKYIAVVINSYAGHNFENVNQLRILIEDRTADGAVEIAEDFFPIQGSQNAALMAVLTRTENGWDVASRDNIFSGGKDWLSIADTVKSQLTL